MSKREGPCSQGADIKTDNIQVKRLERSFKILMNERGKECCDTNVGRGNCSMSSSWERPLTGDGMGSGLSLEG